MERRRKHPTRTQPDAVDPAEAAVLRAASVFGATFWRDGLAAVAPGLDGRRAGEALAALEARGAVRRARSRLAGQEAWEFVDGRLAVEIEAATAPGERAAAHARAARWLQAAGELDAAAVASHLLRGDAPAEAAPWCAEAARAALADHDYDGALAWSEHAVALGVDPATEGALRMLQTSVHDARGAIEQAERCAAEAWRVAPRGGMEWFRAAGSLAVIAMRRLRPERFRELAPALDEALRNPSVGVAAAGLAGAVYPMLQAGQYALADLLLERLEEILASGEHPEPTFPARVFAARALRANFDGDPARFVEESRRAARAYEAHGDARFALLHWNNVGFGLLSLGDAAGAAAAIEYVIDGARARDLQRIALAARHNLGLARMLMGRLDEALALESEVIAGAEALGDGHLAAMARVYRARVRLAAGDHGGALGDARAGMAALPAHPGAQVFARAIEAAALVGAGRPAEALRAAEDGVRVLGTLGSVEEGEGLLRLARVEALAASGERERAAAALGDAKARLLERARRCPGEAARLRFLYDIPEHARTLTLDLG